MTEQCIRFSSELKDFFNTGLCDRLTTENLLYTWIEMNGADDIYFMLEHMRETVRDNKPNNYSTTAKDSLKELNETIYRIAESMNKAVPNG